MWINFNYCGGKRRWFLIEEVSDFFYRLVGGGDMMVGCNELPSESLLTISVFPTL